MKGSTGLTLMASLVAFAGVLAGRIATSADDFDYWHAAASDAIAAGRAFRLAWKAEEAAELRRSVKASARGDDRVERPDE